uniref:Uncharacterized protein n=1 Tax=Sphaerodactylus townsendi TaxID=933632 RepID=A0ACB8GDI8_9SAUR
MVDWARNSEDRVVIPKNIFTPMSTELDESTVFVLGAVLYKNLELILPTLRGNILFFLLLALILLTLPLNLSSQGKCTIAIDCYVQNLKSRNPGTQQYHPPPL